MLRITIFVVLQILVSVFAIKKGGSPERAAGWLLLAAMIVSILGGVPAEHFRKVAEMQFVIDAALLIGLLAIALRANRYWPIWLSSLQLMAIGVHGVRWIDPFLIPSAYYRTLMKIAYPMCFALVLGTYHYLRRQRIEGRPPAAWAPLRW